LFQNDLQRNYDQISSYLDNGIANQADLDVVQVEQLNAIQARVRIDTSVKSYRRMLSAMIGEPVDEASVLQKPELEGLLISAQINCPELSLFEAHNEKKQIKMSKEHEVKINNYLCKNFYPLNNKKTWKINMQYQYRSTHCRRYLA
jgi:hypothetical protein